MIHICFSLHDKTGRYSKFTGTAITSVFENTNSEVTAHILHDNTLTQDNRDKFIYLAGRYNQLVKFYNVEELCPDKLAEILELTPEAKDYRITVGAFYRLTAPEILPYDIDKIIYLDSDIIVNLDIKELWQIELGNKILAAVPEILSVNTTEHMKHHFKLCTDGIVKCEDYFNSGVLFADLNRLREEKNKIMDGLRFRAQNPRYGDYFDQNILNYCFSTQALKLPIKFNRFTYYARSGEEVVAKKIYHYAGGSYGYGLGLDMTDKFDRLWIKYFAKTPWFNVEAIGRLYESFRQNLLEEKLSAMNLLTKLSGKVRAFIVFEDKLDMLLKNFSLKNDEEIFTVKPGTPLKKLINVMNDSRNEKIFFIMLPEFPFKILEEVGFVKGKDFIDIWEFSLKYNSYPLVKSM